MLQQNGIIINQILILALLTLTGFTAGRTGYLPQDYGVFVSNIVIKLTAPALVITTMASYDFTAKTMLDGAWISLYAILFVLASYLIGAVTSKLLGLKDSTSNVYKMHSMFGNVGYLAMPLLNSLFGAKGLVYAVFFVIPHDTILWTIGIYLVNKHNNMRWKDNLKQLLNGNTISFLIGIVFIIINVKDYVDRHPWAQSVYNVLYGTFNPLGNATLYLTMLFIGLILSGIRVGGISGILKRYPTLVLSLFKLLAVPVGAYIVLTSLGQLVDPFVKVVVVLELAMPCAVLVTALAARYESDYKFATENVFFTTLFSMLTLPVMLYLLCS